MNRHPPLFDDLDAESQRLVGQVFCVLAAWESGKRLVEALVSGDLRLSGAVWAEYQRGVEVLGQPDLALPSSH
jgi:hypothetical protein